MEIERNVYLDRLIPRERNGMVKVVTGMRRCGKSYLLFKLFKKHLLDSSSVLLKIRPRYLVSYAQI